MFQSVDEAMRVLGRLEGFTLRRVQRAGRSTCQAVLVEEGRRIYAEGRSELGAINRAYAALAAERRTMRRKGKLPTLADRLPSFDAGMVFGGPGASAAAS